MLQALSVQPVVQEAELRKFLAEKGLTGVLIKAIIGDIVRKTGALGLPWVEVRYVQGRFRYRLRPDAVSNPSIQQAGNDETQKPSTTKPPRRTLLTLEYEDG